MSSSNEKNKTNPAGGIGFTGALTIAFIVLKLCGVIDWSWVWVLSPIWIVASICAVIIVVAIFSACVIGLAKRAKKHNREKKGEP